MNTDFQIAQEDFKQARRKGILHDMFGHIRGHSNDLLSFEDVRNKLHGTQGAKKKRTDIPLKAIIGSVGRYRDFNRDFLPRTQEDQERWANVSTVFRRGANLPPIEVYKIGEAYFVQDGNHRVSIAKRRGQEYIDANVIEIAVPVDLKPDDDMDDVIRLAEYADFLERTGIKDLFADADLDTTEAGGYGDLLDQIDKVLESTAPAGEEASRYKKAVAAWYTETYLPTLEVIRSFNLLRHYPDRTETDMFIWLHQHQQELSEETGFHLDPASAAADLNAMAAETLRSKVSRSINPSSESGTWRKEHISRNQGRMFRDILVWVDESHPNLVSHGIHVAENEDAHLLGVYISGNGERQIPSHIQADFDARCLEAGVQGQLTFGKGKPQDILQTRMRWADLAVLPPPEPGADMKKYHHMIARCPIPVWIGIGEPTACRRAVLAFDGSPKANEALFMTSYLAMFWDFSVSIVTVNEKGASSTTLKNAADYLEQYGIEPEPFSKKPPAAEAILETAKATGANLIITGNYHAHRFGISEVGHTVDTLMVNAEVPLLICR